uniref:Reverse transcriptase Ty1/copia-type domain-containing protein n=1 Tax=Tanacetum cinerariifolium TaxID=118510 RepID=A0A6L2JHE3_TANCI|nr:hypothetical protein [Tanacetum cinerariifolium]
MVVLGSAGNRGLTEVEDGLLKSLGTWQEDITYSDDEDVVGAEADFNNLESSIRVSLIPTIRIQKDHPVSQIIGDLSSTTQTRSMKRVVKDQGGTQLGTSSSQRSKAIGTKWVYMNKKDERGIVVRKKARLVAKGHTQEDEIDYEEVFALVVRIEAIRLFLAYASFMGFMVKKKKDGIFISQDKYVAKILRKFGLTKGKSASTLIDTEKPLLKDLDGEDVDVHTYRSMIVKRIFRYLKGKPHLGLWYPKDSPFDLVPYSDSDYAGASLDRKSTTRGCQFFGCRLISWQCKKQTVVATSSTKAEYVAAATCCTQVLCIQNQLLDYGKQIGDLSTHTIKYTSPALTQKVFANMRRVGKGFSGVETPLFEGMLVEQVVKEGGDEEEHVKDDTAAQGDDTTAQGNDAPAPSIPSPTPPTPPLQPP